MNREAIQKWINALRSGKYKQCKGRLRSGLLFCATGILCDLHAKEYLIGWKITELTRADLYCGSSVNLPEEVLRWAGITIAQAMAIASLNDEGYSFNQIATHIESTEFGATNE